MKKRNEKQEIVDRYISKAFNVFRKKCSERITSLESITTRTPCDAKNKYVGVNDDRSTPLLYLNCFYKSLTDCLGLICASPKRALLFKKFYVFPENVADGNIIHSELLDDYKILDKKDGHKLGSVHRQLIALDRGSTVFVNGAAASVTSFARHLIYLSKCKKKHFKKQSQERFLFLTGAFGEGKTFFTNYLLSVHAHLFIKTRTIAIKVDLTSIHTLNVTDIERLIDEKLLRILHEHYFNDKRKPKFSVDDLLHYMHEQEHNRGTYQTVFKCSTREMLADYCKCQEPGSIKLASSENIRLMALACKEYIVSKLKHSFVYLLDGFDNYNRDSATKEQFEYRITALLTVLNTASENYAYLVIMRNESYHTYMQRSGEAHVNRFSRVRLFDVSMREIVHRKVEHHKLLCQMQSKGKYSNICEDDFAISDDVRPSIPSNAFNTKVWKQDPHLHLKFYKLLERFIAYAFAYHNIDIGDESLIISLFEGYNRTTLAALQVVAKEILWHIERKYQDRHGVQDSVFDELIDLCNNEHKATTFIQKKYYLVFQALMLNGKYFARDRHSFDTIKSGGVEHYEPHARQNKKSYSFICNIFNFRRYGEGVFVGTHSNLICLRVLQYCCSRGDGLDAVGMRQMSADLFDRFNYSKDSVYSATYFLHASLCVEFQDLESYNEHEVPVVATKLGKILATKLITSYAYLEYVIDDVPLDVEYLKAFLAPALSALMFSSTRANFNFRDFAQVLGIRQLRVFALLCYLKRLEFLEFKIHESFSKDLFFSFHNVIPLAFTDMAYKSCMKSIYNITASNFDIFLYFCRACETVYEKSHIDLRPFALSSK